MRRLAAALAGVLVIVFTASTPAYGELDRATVAASTFDPQVGRQLPLQLSFLNEDGLPVALGDYLTGKPVILSLNYFHCQYLCPIEEDGLIAGLNGIRPTLGSDYTLLTVSIDAQDGPGDAALIKARGLRGYNRAQGASGWHLLTSDQPTIDALAQAVGFQSTHDPQANDFAHPIGALVINADGRIGHYLYGIEFDSSALQAALTDVTDNGPIGTLLVCYHFDPLTGRYSSLALNVLRIGGGLTVAGLGLLLWRLGRGA